MVLAGSVGKQGSVMKIDHKLLNRIEEGMAFAKIAFLLVFGFICIAFRSFAYSTFGSNYFTKSWIIEYLDWLGAILIIIALAHFIHGTYTLFRYGGIAFSGKSALERWRKEWELLTALHFFNNTGLDIPDIFLDELRENPEGLVFFEKIINRISSAAKKSNQNNQEVNNEGTDPKDST